MSNLDQLVRKYMDNDQNLGEYNENGEFLAYGIEFALEKALRQGYYIGWQDALDPWGKK